MQERLALSKIRHNEWEEEKRKEIIDHKRLRLTQITEKLQEIDRERRLRREKNLSKRSKKDNSLTKSKPALSKDTMSESSLPSSASSSLSDDPSLKNLHEKLAMKRAARLSRQSKDLKSNYINLSSKPESPEYIASLNISKHIPMLNLLKKPLTIPKYNQENKWSDLEYSDLENSDRRSNLRNQQIQLQKELDQEERKTKVMFSV